MLVLSLLIFSAAVWMTAQVPETASTLQKPDESPLFVERYSELQPSERISIQVYERCNRGVVNIDTQKVRNISFGPISIGQIDEPGAGSGIVLDKEGHILTNNHVIFNVDAVTVTLFNGESFDAELVGRDLITDLAVIRIDVPPEMLFPINFGDSTKLLVGQQIFAIGNPFGLERTLTGGLVSSLNRSVPSRMEGRSIRGLIQTDAAINPGNSGGALLDTQGRLIGINTAIASSSGGSHGIGFAIPSKTITRIVPHLLKNGKVIRGETGIEGGRVVVRKYPGGIKVQGLLIMSLTENGPAEKGGLRGPKTVRSRGSIQFDESTADIITAVDGVPIMEPEDFTAIIDDRVPNDRVVFDVFREGKTLQIPITLK
jgi:S1-C subfamily serine protease